MVSRHALFALAVLLILPTITPPEDLVSENASVNEVGHQGILGLQFQPFLQNSVPVQRGSQTTMPLKTANPSGAATFESARAYFDRALHLSFPAGGSGKPYVLHAEFVAKGSGGVETGHYQDTWISNTQWRREASLGKSRYIRARSGDKRYELAEGPDVQALVFLLRALEPIPAVKTFVESDWRIRRDTIKGILAIRVLSGPESPEGMLDPQKNRAFWFDDSGLLRRTYLNGFGTNYSDFQAFAGFRIPQQVFIMKDEALAIRVHVTDLKPAAAVSPALFMLRGHEAKRVFTAEER